MKGLRAPRQTFRGFQAPRQTFRGFQAPQMNNVRALSTDRWGAGFCSKHFRAPGLRSTPPPPRPWLAANKSLAFFFFSQVRSMVSKEKIIVSFLIVFHFIHFKTLSLYPTRINRKNSENLQKKHRGHHHCCQTTLSREKEGS